MIRIGEKVSFISMPLHVFCFAAIVTILVAPVQARVRPNEVESCYTVPAGGDTPRVASIP